MLKTLLLQDEMGLVPAPQDFPPSLSSLAQLDQALRCPICGDLYTAPVMMSMPRCSHSFCSTCLRTSLSLSATSAMGAAGSGGVGGSKRCPVCREPGDEDKIRPLSCLEDAVNAWVKARAVILQLVAAVESSQNSDDEDAPDQRLRSRKRIRTSATPCLTSKSDLNSREARRSKGKTSRTNSKSDDEIMIVEHKPKASSMVECPMCSKLLPASIIETHASACSGVAKSGTASSSAWAGLGLGTQRKKSSDAKSISEDMNKLDREKDRLSSVNYSLIKLKDLKTRLKALQLAITVPTSIGNSVTSQHDELAARHARWTLIWNAELDKSPGRRRTVKDLRKELDLWDKERERLRESRDHEVGGTEAIKFGTSAKPTTNATSGEPGTRSHLVKYSDEFQRMIFDVKERNARHAETTAALPPDVGEGGTHSNEDAMELEQMSEVDQPVTSTAALPSSEEPGKLTPDTVVQDSPAKPTSDASSPGSELIGPTHYHPLRSPSPDPYVEQLRRAGPYRGDQFPAPSQDVFGGRREGMGFGGWGEVIEEQGAETELGADE